MRFTGFASLFLLVAFWGCGLPGCPVPKVGEAALTDLRPGHYEITLRARSGSQRGALSKGDLFLVPTSAEDRSPATGKGPAKGEDRQDIPLYGWLNLDLDRVGALLDEECGPAPDSQDPIEPGVLVTLFEGRPVLKVGTVNQTRNPVVGITEDGLEIIRLATDGYRIGLEVRRANASGFRGKWSEWGIVRDGRGTFCASRIGYQPRER